MLPQQNDEWARSVFAIIQPSDTTLAPVALMLVQESPRENYKVHYLITLEPGFVLPPVAPGADRLRRAWTPTTASACCRRTSSRRPTATC